MATILPVPEHGAPPPEPPPGLERKNPNVRGFLRRLSTNTLKPQDRTTLARAAEVKRMRAEGKTVAQMAKHLCVSTRTFAQWTRGPMAKAALQHLEDGAGVEQDRHSERMRHRARQRMDAKLDTIDKFLDDCLLFNETKNGREWRDPTRAQWASERVMKSTGIDQPVASVRPTIQIGELVIVQRMEAIANYEAKLKQRARQISAEYTLLPSPAEPAP